MSESIPKRLGRTVIYESDWVSLYVDRVQKADGTIVEKHHNVHCPHDSVCVAVFNENGDMLLIRNSRYITQRTEWECPAGRVEDGETPEQAARRECLEETGCTLRELRHLCTFNPNNGTCDLTVHAFAAVVETEGGIIDTGEISAKRWFTIAGVRELLHTEMHSGVSMLTAMYALESRD